MRYAVLLILMACGGSASVKPVLDKQVTIQAVNQSHDSIWLSWYDLRGNTGFPNPLGTDTLLSMEEHCIRFTAGRDSAVWSVYARGWSTIAGDGPFDPAAHPGWQLVFVDGEGGIPTFRTDSTVAPC